MSEEHPLDNTIFCSASPFDTTNFKYLTSALFSIQAGKAMFPRRYFCFALVITHCTQGLMVGISTFLKVYFEPAVTVPEVWEVEWQETNMVAARRTIVNWIFI